MSKNPPDWYMPGSVLSALWGSVMPRLAASVWKGRLGLGGLIWPPPGAAPQLIFGDLYAYRIAGSALVDFWDSLAKIAFGSARKYRRIQKEIRAGRGTNGHRLTNAELAAHVVLDYFDPRATTGQKAATRIPMRVIHAESYDFILSSDGLDVFIPRDPFVGEDRAVRLRAGRIKVLQMYKFRETGRPPIGLPGLPATFAKNGDDRLISIPQLTAPTGAYQLDESWARGRAGDVAWWISGTSYRGMMNALPRIIASMWYEKVVWPQEPLTVNGAPNPRTTRGRFGSRLRELLEERMETILPAKMKIDVRSARRPVPTGATSLPGWNARDIMITNEGMVFPDPGPPPEAKALLDAIEAGNAGNPVFTDTGS